MPAPTTLVLPFLLGPQDLGSGTSLGSEPLDCQLGSLGSGALSRTPGSAPRTRSAPETCPFPPSDPLSPWPWQILWSGPEVTPFFLIKVHPKVPFLWEPPSPPPPAPGWVRDFPRIPELLTSHCEVQLPRCWSDPTSMLPPH